MELSSPILLLALVFAAYLGVKILIGLFKLALVIFELLIKVAIVGGLIYLGVRLFNHFLTDHRRIFHQGHELLPMVSDHPVLILCAALLLGLLLTMRGAKSG